MISDDEIVDALALLRDAATNHLRVARRHQIAHDRHMRLMNLALEAAAKLEAYQAAVAESRGQPT